MKIIPLGKVAPVVGAVSNVTNTLGADVVLHKATAWGAVVGDKVRVVSVGGATQVNGTWWVVDKSTTQIKISATEGGAPLQGDGNAYTSGGSVFTCPRLSSDPTMRVRKLRAQVIAGEVGRKFIGNSSMKTTAAGLPGVLKEFWPNASGGVSDSWTVSSPRGNQIRPYDLFADVLTSGEGLVVVAWQR